MGRVLAFERHDGSGNRGDAFVQCLRWIATPSAAQSGCGIVGSVTVGGWCRDPFRVQVRGVAVDLDRLGHVGWRGGNGGDYTDDEVAALINDREGVDDLGLVEVMRGRIALVTLTDNPSWGCYLRRSE